MIQRPALLLAALPLLAALALPPSAAQDNNQDFGIPLSDNAVISDSASANKTVFAYPSNKPVVSDLVLIFSAGRASASELPDVHDSARAYASGAVSVDVVRVEDDTRASLQPPVMLGEAPVISDSASSRVFTPPPAPPPTEPPVRGGGSGVSGIVLAVIHGVSWDTCADDGHVLVTASPADGLSVSVERDGVSSAARKVGAAAAPPGAYVWKAAVAPTQSEVTVTAQLSAARSDEQAFVMGSCSGSAGYTPFYKAGSVMEQGAPPAAPPAGTDKSTTAALPASGSDEAPPVVMDAGAPPDIMDAAAPPAVTDQAAEARPAQGDGDIRVEDGVLWEVTPAPLTDEPGSMAAEPVVLGEPAVQTAPAVQGEPPDLWWLAVLGAGAAVAAVVAWRLHAQRAGRGMRAPA